MTKHTDDTTEAAVANITNQPALPALELPEYHGRQAVKMKTALTGAGSRITRPHSIGDRVVLVIEARVKSAGHEDTDDGLEYVEKVKVLDLFELAGDQGSRLISTVRSLYRTAEDQVKGKTPIADLGEKGYTDGSGVALTAKELAELRGDPIRAILSPDLTPAVVVYSDGARELWPDMFPKDAPRPKLGEVYLSDGGNVEVVKLLHHDTGEELVDVSAPAAAPELADRPPTPAEAAAEEADAMEQARESEAADSGRAHLSAVPPLPGEDDEAPADTPDPFSGELGDNVAGWEDPDPATAARLAAANEAKLPTTADFGFVDTDLDALRPLLGTVTDLAHARRLVEAEKQGRGRGLKPRAGALKMLEARVTLLEDAEHQAARAAQMEGEG